MAIVRPGMHAAFNTSRFGPDECEIIEKLKQEWYLTNSGNRLNIAKSKYDFILIKPLSEFTEAFNIDRELVVVFCSYPSFEPRSFDAFDAAYNQLSDLRPDTVCRVLISRDNEIEQKIVALLKNDPEQPIVIPFTYEELIGNRNLMFMHNRFRKHFYSRDLFAFSSPLKKDLYFFGRTDLIHQIVNRHKSGEHTGLFGLRKCGKTSIIYALERHLSIHNIKCIQIDCESPSVHMLRWNELLFRIVSLFYKGINNALPVPSQDKYDEKHAADSFENDILAISKTPNLVTTLILFDEIEKISPKTASSDHWRTGADFVFFWQSMRGFFQKHPSIFTYMLVGTNPNCIEAPLISNHENPLFGSIPSTFVPSFTLDQVKQMVLKLGSFMGLTFDEIVIAKLTDDYGGHPFIIRQFCSLLHKSLKESDRPLLISKTLYETTKVTFERDFSDYFGMILQVLQEWYPDEYDMLRFLAQDDMVSFNQFESDNINYTKHLIGYGLICKSKFGFSFTIESIKTFLNKIHKYQRLNLTQEEKRTEISIRRNKIEHELRILIKRTLILLFGKKKATELILSSIPEKRRNSLSNNLDILLSKDDSPLYFLDIVQIISREWENFKNIFEMEKDKTLFILNEINESGRPDAHANSISENDFTQI
ncbi:MAG: hypothetical protein GX638_18075, partial [Crenarchaeota archaeon]|nr:hypothetical protein [Thermoproteota archaeon]